MALAHARNRRFTRAEYYRMSDLGILKPGERTELIDGEIVTMPAQNLPHANAVTASNMILTSTYFETHAVRCQLPVTLADDCEPEPDFALVTAEHMRESNLQGKHPTCPDLILEISDRSLGYDRGEKVGLFARAGVPEYWILNVQRRILEVRRDPASDEESPFGFHYRSIRLHSEAERVAPLFAAGREVVVGDLLGPRVPEKAPADGNFSASSEP